MGNDDTILHFSRELAMKTTVATAVVYNVLEYRKKHFKEQLNEQDEFWSSIVSIADYTGFTERTVTMAVNTLEELGLVERRTSYRPGTMIKTTFWKVHKLNKFQGDNPEKNSGSILKEGKQKIESEVEDEEYDIPLANVTTKYVEISVYDTDDNGKTITVPHKVTAKEWNKAVRKWRKDNSQFVRIEFADTGDTVSLRPSQIKKWNVRPKNTPSYKKDSGFVYAKQ